MYDADTKLYSDECWMNAKDYNNDKIEKYAVYYNDSAQVKKETGTFPEIANDHINLRGRPGYGLSDDYLIDTYSKLITPTMTHDRCNIQLIERTFASGPALKKMTGDLNKELDVLSGSDSRLLPVMGRNNDGTQKLIKCAKGSIMETSMNNMMPLLDCIKDVQRPEHIISEGIRGGEDTRSYINKAKFSKCRK